MARSTVTLTQLRRQLGELVSRAAYGADRIVLITPAVGMAQLQPHPPAVGIKMVRTVKFDDSHAITDLKANVPVALHFGPPFLTVLVSDSAKR